MRRTDYDDPNLLTELYHWSQLHLSASDQRVIALRRAGWSWDKIGRDPGFNRSHEWARRRLIRSKEQYDYWRKHGELLTVTMGRPRKGLTQRSQRNE